MNVCVCVFPEEEINNMKLELDKYGIHLPAFNKIGGILAKELSVDEAAGSRHLDCELGWRGPGAWVLSDSGSVFPPVHAAVIAINEALERGHLEGTAASLRNPNALLSGLQEALMSVYQEILQQAKTKKKQHAAMQVRGQL